jgi:hypothetical protein
LANYMTCMTDVMYQLHQNETNFYDNTYCFYFSKIQINK